MNILRLALVGVAILLGVVLASPVYAIGGVFVIQPNQDAAQSLPSLNPDESAAGNFSATGPIDFYAMGPNGTLLLFYNHTEFSDFEFSPDVTGICTICMVNCGPTNVNVTLTYGLNFVVVCYETVTFTMSAATAVQHSSQTSTIPPPSHITTPPPTSIPKIPMPRIIIPSDDWSGILDFMKNNIGIIFGAIVGSLGSIFAWLKKLPSRLRWWLKYRRNRTPATILDSLS